MQTPHRFILIDDDSTNNMICTWIIERFFPDADIRSFEYPEEAIDYIRNEYTGNIYDRRTLIFLDIHMPRINGWQFMEIFENLQDIKQEQFIIYILSSSVDSRDKEKAGANPLISGFLSKPLENEWFSNNFKDFDS